MKRTVLCLSFLLLLLTGCVAEEESGMHTKEEIRGMERGEHIVVLTDGTENTKEIGEKICESIGGVIYEIPFSQKEELQYAVKQAKKVLIGTEKQVKELEFSLRNCLEREGLAGKQVSFYLIGREKEDFVKEVKEWYPQAELLPFIKLSKEEEKEEAWGRILGWLTTVYTGYIK